MSRPRRFPRTCLSAPSRARVGMSPHCALCLCARVCAVHGVCVVHCVCMRLTLCPHVVVLLMSRDQIQELVTVIHQRERHTITHTNTRAPHATWTPHIMQQALRSHIT